MCVHLTPSKECLPVVVFFLHRRANNVASLRLCACVYCMWNVDARNCSVCVVLFYFIFMPYSSIFLGRVFTFIFGTFNEVILLLSAYAFSLFFHRV